MRNPLDFWTARRIGLRQTSLTRAALTEWQMKRLRQTVEWAARKGAFYRRHLADVAGKPIQCLDDLAVFPFTTAEDIAADPLRFVCLSQSDINRVVTLETSGTTGAPKRLFFTKEDQEITLDFFDHGLRLMAQPDDKVMILLPGDKPGSVGDLLFRAIPRFGGQPLLAGLPNDVAASSELAMREDAALLIGIPVHILAMARYWRTQGWPTGRLRNVLLCSDNVSDAVRREISSIWNCGVFQDWGMTELGFGGGVDCAAHHGYHLQESDFLFEIVDAENGRPLPPGQTGEIVVTTLTRQGMPLIRYKTGDLSRFIAERCACGSVLRRLDRIETRKTGRLSLDGGDVSMAILDDALFNVPAVADFSVQLNKNETPPRLCVRISPETGQTMDAETLQTAVRSALDALAPLRAACESGALRYAIELLPEKIPFSRRKRMIEREASS